MSFPLEKSDPETLGFASEQLAKLDRLIVQHIDEGRYSGAQIALARHGKLALYRSFGSARTEPGAVAVTDRTLFLLFSNTKVLVSSAVWLLIQDGRVSLGDRVADHLPEFSANGKGDITIFDVITHQGGFPNANISRPAWSDHALSSASRPLCAGDADRGCYR
jgi:CubicO group peptidase (beta-lactamase class C family)